MLELQTTQKIAYFAMLSTVQATRFIRPMESGKTSPYLIECEDAHGGLHEVVVKYSVAMMEKEKYLAMEAIVAMLAADLELPVAEPFVVEIDDLFIDSLQDSKFSTSLRSSCRQAFGTALKTGVNAWIKNQLVPDAIAQTAAEIAVFDQIIINSDRRPDTPNCLTRGDDLLIIDHEMAFFRYLFWQEPWQDGGLRALEERDKHIFAKPYVPAMVTSLDRFATAWEGLPTDRLDSYLAALPSSWVYDERNIVEILSYLKDCQRNIRTITANALKVYS